MTSTRSLLLTASVAIVSSWMLAACGPNIPPADRETIMEPFHHGAGGQIGLGLAIAKGIIEAHHGQIRVEDTPGGGATFLLTLPVAVPQEDINHENPGC